MQKQALTYLHILPSQYDNEDYYEMNEILSAKEEKDRVHDAMDFVPGLKK
ncbi:hypothetical protein [Liquorilactobacillus uvarum]|nr:hypothetical protein [Liquorilactobacillus uvarum]